MQVLFAHLQYHEYPAKSICCFFINRHYSTQYAAKIYPASIPSMTQPSPTRILILTADAGFGHRRAAIALAQAFEELYGQQLPG